MQALVQVAVVVEAREAVGDGLLLQGLAGAGVVDGDRGVVGDRLRDQHVVVVEAPYVARLADVEQTDDRVAKQQRHGDAAQLAPALALLYLLGGKGWFL